MRILILLFVVGCASPHRNLAANYVGAVEPSAACIAWGDDSVLCHKDKIIFYCSIGTDKHVGCQLITDLTPKIPAPAIQSTPSPTMPPEAPPPPKEPSNPGHRLPTDPKPDIPKKK